MLLRYWQVVDRIPNDLQFRLISEATSEEFEISEPNQKFFCTQSFPDPQDAIDEAWNDSEVRSALWDYLMLCEDQIDQRIAGQITDETWEIWADGIMFNLRGFPFQPAFHRFEEEFERQGVPKPERPLMWLRMIDQKISEVRQTDSSASPNSIILKDPLGKRRIKNYVASRRGTLPTLNDWWRDSSGLPLKTHGTEFET